MNDEFFKGSGCRKWPPPHVSELEASGSLSSDLVKGVLAALAVTACLLFINCDRLPATPIIFAALYCGLMHVVYFTVGARTVSVWLRTRLEGEPWRFLLVPLLLSGLLVAYMLAVQGNPLHWPQVKPWIVLTYLAALPLAAVLPVLLFLRQATGATKAVGGRDFLLFGVAAGVAGTYHFPSDAIPVVGASFETGSQLTLLLVLVYAAVVVRRLKRVGFNLEFTWKDVLLTLGCWLIMLALFAGMLYPAGLIEYAGYRDLTWRGFRSGTRYFLFHLLSVGAFEELVFRGLFQNMLAQMAERLSDKTRKRLLAGSAAFLCAAAFTATFLIANARFHWFTPLVVLVIFAGTYLIETRCTVKKGEYIVLAIISAVFGIVHFRFGVVFMALACLAGWFDGFVYTKTKNVLLAALIHALLNCSAMFFGLHTNF